MHEYAVTKSFVDIVIKEAEKHSAGKVSRITLVIGELSSIIDDSVRLYFDLIAEGTITEGAELVFKRVKAEFFCKNCQLNFEKPSKGFDCPKCGNLGVPTDVGKEFYVESIEIG